MKDNFPYLYPYSRQDAERQGELELWRESHRENIACKEAIESAIRSSFDGMHLQEGCVSSVIEQYGFRRVAWVLFFRQQGVGGENLYPRGRKPESVCRGVPFHCFEWVCL